MSDTPLTPHTHSSHTPTPTPTPKTPSSARFEDNQFFGKSFNLATLADAAIPRPGDTHCHLICFRWNTFIFLVNIKLNEQFCKLDVTFICKLKYVTRQRNLLVNKMSVRMLIYCFSCYHLVWYIKLLLLFAIDWPVVQAYMTIWCNDHKHWVKSAVYVHRWNVWGGRAALPSYTENAEFPRTVLVTTPNPWPAASAGDAAVPRSWTLPFR